jgi:transposase
MANKILAMYKIRLVVRLHAQGESKKKIVALTGAAMLTVRKYIELFIKLKLTVQDLEEKSDVDVQRLFDSRFKCDDEPARYKEFQQLIPELVKRLSKRGSSAFATWQAYRKEYPGGYGYTQFTKHINAYTTLTRPTMHIEHKSGDKMYIDFAGDRLHFVDEQTGELTYVQVFAAILGCSQLAYVEAVPDQKTASLITATENALRYYGGVPHVIVPDNLKAAVIRHTRYDPTLNEAFADFAQFYDTIVLPARPYKPKDKALVEGLVKIIYREIYPVVNAKAHTSLQDLNKSIFEALNDFNNKPFKQKGYSRRQHFDEVESDTLKPLPLGSYEFFDRKLATVHKSGHVWLAEHKHYYSVPHTYSNKSVRILFNSTTVSIFFDLERIAVHPVGTQPFGYSTIPAHRPDHQRDFIEWSYDRALIEAGKISAVLKDFLQMVFNRKRHVEDAHRTYQAIMKLASKAGPQRIENACKRAISYNAYNYEILRRIIENNMDSLPIDEPMNEPTANNPAQTNEFIRGKEYYTK